MSKIIGSQKSKFKIQRYLGVELPGLGKAGALERRPYRPGQHGASRKKLSDYAIQLLEKQKLRYHYGVKEYQLRTLVKKAKRVKGRAWIDSLIIKLESRLDNVLFRAQFANSMAASRQLVSHAQVRVNGKKVTAPGQIIGIGDKIELTRKGFDSQTYLGSQHSPRLPVVPAYLKVSGEKDKTIEFVAEPLPVDVPFELNTALVTDFYSKIKA